MSYGSKEERLNGIAKALYEYRPIIEQEIDTLDGSPKGPAVTISWEEVTSDYPATYEAIIEMATVAAKYLDNGGSLPHNAYTGIGSENIKQGSKVIKYELGAYTGKVDELYEVDGKTLASIVWDEGCVTDDIEVTDLVLAEEG
jgi:hypothetical protein